MELCRLSFQGVSEAGEVIGTGLIGVKNRLFLERGDFGDTLLGKVEHGGHLFGGKHRLFAAALDFDKFMVLGHDNIEIDTGVFVFRVIEIEDRCILVDAGADAADQLFHRESFEFSLGHQGVEGDGNGDASPGDGGGAGSAVSLENVAIQPNGAFTECFEIDDGAEGAADQALDFGGPTVDFSTGDIARFSIEGGVGEHVVFGGEPAPADFLHLHPAGYVFLDGGGADHSGIAKGDEYGACGVWRDTVLEGDGAELIKVAAVGSGHVKRLKFAV